MDGKVNELRQSNIFQVDLGINFEDGLIVMPTGLPGFEQARENEGRIGACSMFKISELQVYMRLHEYYMGEQNHPSIGQ